MTVKPSFAHQVGCGLDVGWESGGEGQAQGTGLTGGERNSWLGRDSGADGAGPRLSGEGVETT